MTFLEYYRAKPPTERRLLSTAIVLFSLPFECKGWLDDHAKCNEEEQSAYYLRKAKSAAVAYRQLWLGFIELVCSSLATPIPRCHAYDAAYGWLKHFFDEGLEHGFFELPWGVGNFWSMHMRMLAMAKPQAPEAPQPPEQPRKEDV